MSLYYYKVYDTVIESQIRIMNLPVIESIQKATARIEIIDYPSELVTEKNIGVYYSPTESAIAAEWGTMEVKSGNLIRIYIDEAHTEQDVAPFIIGWGFAFLFNQRGHTIFHCSALNINGKGVMISGVSGAGKSTTALSLIRSGAKYIADDMAVFEEKGKLELIPAYPIQKVCSDVAIRFEEKDCIMINEGRGKYALYNSEDYCDTRVKATHVVMLNINEGEKIVTKEHKGIDKWMKILECMYLNEFFVTNGTPEKDKVKCLKLAEAVRVLEISRPRDKNTTDDISVIISEFVNS